MKEQICYSCIRKTECYTKEGLKALRPDKTHEDMTGYECGVPFITYEEMREFIYVIGEAIYKQRAEVQDDIIKFIADRYNLPEYNITIEFCR